jgi:hypothetical protein
MSAGLMRPWKTPSVAPLRRPVDNLLIYLNSTDKVTTNIRRTESSSPIPMPTARATARTTMVTKMLVSAPPLYVEFYYTD